MRLRRVEAIRVISISMIIWAHCQFFDGIKTLTPAAQAWETGIVILARFSIQFFFLASGYFLGGKIMDNPGQEHAIAWKYSKKLLLIFAAWSLVYAVRDPQLTLRLLEKTPLTLLLEGTSVHLWFLMSLSLAIWVFALWPFNRKGYSLLGFGAALYLVGLAGGSYLPTPIGMDLGINPRDGVFFSAFFFSLGAWIHARKPVIHPALAWGLYLGGLIFYSAEAYYLWRNWSSLPIRHDFLLGSIPYGLGVFLISLQGKQDGRLENALSPYGHYVLGLYVIHPLFIELWKPLGTMLPYSVWLFLLPLLVIGTSLAAVFVLSKTPLRRFVM